MELRDQNSIIRDQNQLIVEAEAEAPEQARQLLQRAEQELEDATLRREINRAVQVYPDEPRGDRSDART